jgi:3-keto-disaccharide hydrolase
VNNIYRVRIYLCSLWLILVLVGCRGRSKDRDDDEDQTAPKSTAESTTLEKEEREMYRVEKQGRVYNFDSDDEGTIASGWSQDRTGKGSMGKWVVMKDSTAPSQHNVLAQISQDETGYQFPVAVIDSSSYKDLQLSVRFKPLKGRIDQGAGLVFRYEDINNYYVVRANALEDNVNLYKVVDGSRTNLTSVDVRVTTNQWHTLIIKAQGDQIECIYEGQKLFETKDDTFAGPGKIGLWTKADSYILFDEFTVTPDDSK